MNMIATASANTILAVGLGKYKSVACVPDQAATVKRKRAAWSKGKSQGSDGQHQKEEKKSSTETVRALTLEAIQRFGGRPCASTSEVGRLLQPGQLEQCVLDYSARGIPRYTGRFPIVVVDKTPR